MTLRFRRVLLPATISLLLGTLPAIAQKAPIQITADLTDGPRKLFHAEVDLPVKPGPLTLTTPKWIPGNHRPTGPVDDITGVVFTADGKTLPWRRDDVDLYQFHVTVPAGVTTLHAHLDCIVTERISAKMAVLEWEKLLLYPANIPVKDIAIQPTVTVPQGWGIGTALTPISSYDPQHPAGGTTHFAATTVEQLEDSPIITGEYFHEFPLAPEIKPAHFIDVVSDSPADSNLRPTLLAEIANLVREADAAYASHHYNQYHFLLTLSDVAGGEGLEHGQSSDNGIGEKGFSDAKHQLAESDLLAHEFTHSWNGKYRRPFNLYQADFEKAQQGSLLWVYEGVHPVPRQRPRRPLRPQDPGAIPRPARHVRRPTRQQTRPRVAPHRRHRHRRQHPPRRQPCLEQLEARPGLLPGRRALLARRRHPHPPEDQQRKIPR